MPPQLCPPFIVHYKGKHKISQLIGARAEMTNAYNNGILSLANATLLAHPHSNVPIAVTCDASDIGLGQHWNNLLMVHANL